MFQQINEAYDVLSKNQQVPFPEPYRILDPVIDFFTAAPKLFYSGDEITFKWQTAHAEVVMLKPLDIGVEVISVPLSGQKTFKLNNINQRYLTVELKAHTVRTHTLQSITLENKMFRDAQEKARNYDSSTSSKTVRIKNQVYKTVRIGNQIWMAENLNLDIPGSVCYDNDPANGKTYGRLYSWEEAIEAAETISGWHLPTDEEWKILERTLGMSEADINKEWVWRESGHVGDKLKSGGSSGFNALLAGDRDSAGHFDSLGLIGYFWSASPYGSSSAWGRFVSRFNSSVTRLNLIRTSRFSVRLLKD